MGWRGTGGAAVGAAGTGTYFFFGGLLMILGSIGEVSYANLNIVALDTDHCQQWLIGNTFPFVVFGSFGKYSASLYELLC
jgi:hypothetical protein